MPTVGKDFRALTGAASLKALSEAFAYVAILNFRALTGAASLKEAKLTFDVQSWF